MNNEPSSILRFGYVSDYNPDKHQARVVFPDKDNLVSDWLPVIVHNSLMNHDALHLDINEHVACLMSGNGLESGIILGAFYDNSNTCPENSHDKRAVIFADGTRITYDRDAHELAINCVGKITIEAAENVEIKAADSVSIEANGSSISCGSSGQTLKMVSSGMIFTHTDNELNIEAGSDIRIKANNNITLESSTYTITGERT